MTLRCSKSERGRKGGRRSFLRDRWRESPQGEKDPGEQTVPTRINRPGSEEEYGFFCESLKRRLKAEVVLRESAGAARGVETLLESQERSKALKGEAQERWELREASKG